MRQEERRAYELHGRLPVHRRACQEAVTMIEAKPGHAVSTSWGKDSVALLALAVEARPGLVLLNARYPNPAERFADMDSVRDAVLARPEMRAVRYVEVTCPGEWEMYERVGHAFGQPTASAEREACRWWKRSLDEAMAAALANAGCAGVMLGLRQDESRVRRLNIAVRGAAYVRRDGADIALPLARWTGRDVWAALVTRGMPWLKIYDIASAGRERARSGFVWSTGAIDAIARHGVIQDWRRAYPGELMAWLRRFPELGRLPR